MRLRILIASAILSAIFYFSLTRKSQAFQSTVWLSSNTATAFSTGTLCAGPYLAGTSTVTLRGVLHGICINTAAVGTIQVFSSTWTSVGTITGSLSTTTQEPCNFYDVASPNGLSVNKVGVADTTILYQCY